MIEVYYAEDDEIIGKSVKEYLEQQNCRVTVLRAIADIRKALLNYLLAVILLDWNFSDTGVKDLVFHDNINLRGISPGGVDTFLFLNNGELKLLLVTIRK